MTTQMNKLDLLKLSLTSYGEEYKDLCATWSLLDTKAQGTSALAGIFLAAAFAWTQKVPDSFKAGERLGLLACMVLLVTAVLSAVLALRIKEVDYSPLGNETNTMVTDLKSVKLDDERVEAFFSDQIRVWKENNEKVHKHNLYKAGWVRTGQYCILGAAVAVMMLSSYAIFQ